MIVKRTKEELTLCRLLREAWNKSYLKWDALRRVKIDANQYRCEQCNKVFKLREVQVDHKLPVIDPEKGWQGIQIFAVRLFCPTKSLQVLCIDTCHQRKTNNENRTRRKDAA